MTFASWLISHRPYCDYCHPPIPAEHVVTVKDRNIVLCERHYRAFPKTRKDIVNDKSNQATR